MFAFAHNVKVFKCIFALNQLDMFRKFKVVLHPFVVVGSDEKVLIFEAFVQVLHGVFVIFQFAYV